jgi:hypothetical protein
MAALFNHTKGIQGIPDILGMPFPEAILPSRQSDPGQVHEMICGGWEDITWCLNRTALILALLTCLPLQFIKDQISLP